MTVIRLGGAVILLIALVFIVLGPRSLALMQERDTSTTRRGAELALHSNVWVFRLGAIVMLVAGVAMLILG